MRASPEQSGTFRKSAQWVEQGQVCSNEVARPTVVAAHAPLVHLTVLALLAAREELLDHDRRELLHLAGSGPVAARIGGRSAACRRRVPVGERHARPRLRAAGRQTRHDVLVSLRKEDDTPPQARVADPLALPALEDFAWPGCWSGDRCRVRLKHAEGGVNKRGVGRPAAARTWIALELAEDEIAVDVAVLIGGGVLDVSSEPMWRPCSALRLT